jgi:hypothetical protein
MFLSKTFAVWIKLAGLYIYKLKVNIQLYVLHKLDMY